jgi:predicted Zn-dependent peptidase
VYPEPPAAGPPKPFNFPDVDQFTLDNGLTVYVVPSSEVPVVSAQLVVRCGTMDAEYVAPFTSFMLGEGTRARSKAKLDEAIEFVGGYIQAVSGLHATYMFSEVMDKDLKLALTLMADQIMNPIFPAESLEKQKQQAKTGLSVARNDPAVMAAFLFEMQAYPEGHPYGRPLPSDEQIDEITVEDIKKFHSTFYKANNAFLILAGNVDKATVQPLVERTLGSWKPASKNSLPPNPLNAYKNYALPEKLVLHVVDRPGSAQTEVLVGNLALARNHPDWVKLEVANSLLGDDASGRLFKDVREERGLTYNISSDVDGRQAPGTFYISSRTRTKTTGALLAAVFEHIERFRNETPSEEEVQRVVAKLVGGFPLSLETPDAIAGKVREALIYNLPPDYWVKYRQDLLSVDAAAVQDAARKYVHPIPHVVVVGNPDKIVPQLEKTFPDAEIRTYDANLERK